MFVKTHAVEFYNIFTRVLSTLFYKSLTVRNETFNTRNRITIICIQVRLLCGLSVVNNKSHYFLKQLLLVNQYFQTNIYKTKHNTLQNTENFENRERINYRKLYTDWTRVQPFFELQKQKMFLYEVFRTPGRWHTCIYYVPYVLVLSEIFQYIFRRWSLHTKENLFNW